MPIAVECECGKRLNVPNTLAGKTIRCKACDSTLKVPGRTSKADKPLSTKAQAEKAEDLVELEDGSSPSGRKNPAGMLPAIPRKKKKKKKKQASNDEAEAGAPKWLMPVAILFGLSVGGLGAYLGVRSLSGRAQAQTAANNVPDKFSRHTSTDGGFSFEYPDGWEVSSGGGTGGRPPWGKFSRNDVSFEMRADLKGAPVADMATLNDTGDSPPELSPQAKVHQFQTEIKYSLEMTSYTEVGAGGLVDTPFGKGWKAEFTAAEGAFGGKVHGYRLTYAGGVNQFNVVCKCNEKNWAAYKPMFERVMQSISR